MIVTAKTITKRTHLAIVENDNGEKQTYELNYAPSDYHPIKMRWH